MHEKIPLHMIVVAGYTADICLSIFTQEECPKWRMKGVLDIKHIH